MTIVKNKNPDLYRQWLRWFEQRHPEMAPYAQRTHAFFRAEDGESPRW